MRQQAQSHDVNPILMRRSSSHLETFGRSLTLSQARWVLAENSVGTVPLDMNLAAHVQLCACAFHDSEGMTGGVERSDESWKAREQFVPYLTRVNG